jgi:hypothetical protein
MLDGATRGLGHTGVFNVSIVTAPSGPIVAYRGFSPLHPGAPRAFLCTWSPSGTPTVIDLSDFAVTLGMTRVADPKLFHFGGEVYLTFNTGYVSAGENQIYIVAVTPELGAPQRVVAEFDRQKVEKNWAFAPAPDGSLAAIYQLSPYREVQHVGGRLASDDDLVFRLRTPRSSVGPSSPALTLGTQPVQYDGRHLLVAHEKIVIRGRRMYFGRAITVDGFGTDAVSVTIGPGRLVHTLRDTLPHRGKLNKNLLSATYFSGIDMEGDDVVLGYGINDVRHSIARVERNSLWP